MPIGKHQSIRKNYQVLLRELASVAPGARLIAVSKQQPAERIRELHSCGQRAFGESYVDEALAKMDALADLDDLEWHFIGPMQSNKTRDVAARFHWAQSVDRVKLIQRLQAQRPSRCPPLQVLVQVNPDADPGKRGVDPAAVLEVAQAVQDCSRLRLRGIMGIPRLDAEASEQRVAFRTLRQCFQACRRLGEHVDTLSMGMSMDWRLAVQEGSSMIRLGSVLFGPRDPDTATTQTLGEKQNE